MGRRRRGYAGGFLQPIVNAFLHQVTRSLLVALGLKKPYRGGARISKARNVVDPWYDRKRKEK